MVLLSHARWKFSSRLEMKGAGTRDARRRRPHTPRLPLLPARAFKLILSSMRRGARCHTRAKKRATVTAIFQNGGKNLSVSGRERTRVLRHAVRELGFSCSLGGREGIKTILACYAKRTRATPRVGGSILRTRFFEKKKKKKYTLSQRFFSFLHTLYSN